MTQTPYSDRLPTSQIIDDLLNEADLRAELARAETRIRELERQNRVLTGAADELGDMSIKAQRRMRSVDPSYAGGYEQGMVDAREHILARARLANRNQVVADVRRQLTEAGLDASTAQ